MVNDKTPEVNSDQKFEDTPEYEKLTDELEILNQRFVNYKDTYSSPLSLSAYERVKLKNDLEETQHRIKQIERRLVDLRLEFDKKLRAIEEELPTRERITVQKVIAGFLIDKYKENELRHPYTIAKDIEGALQSYGIKLTDDTIAKWIEEALQLLNLYEK